jgi:hypothetical protein
MPLRLCHRDAKRYWRSKAHTTKHVKVLRARPASPQIKIAIADAANYGFVPF